MVVMHEKLYHLRMQNGLTRSQVAERLGVTVSLISAYELGSRKPSLENLLALSNLYHVTTDYLLGKPSISNCISTDGLSMQQIDALLLLINDLKKNNQNG